MLGKYLECWLYWKILRIKYAINYKKVVIVLSGENKELDRQVIVHLPDYMKRKRANKALIIVENNHQEYKSILQGEHYKWINMTEKRINKLYYYYCFSRFFDNIVFTFVDKPKDNLLGKYLRETEINEEDAACLALYHLRQVPRIGGL